MRSHSLQSIRNPLRRRHTTVRAPLLDLPLQAISLPLSRIQHLLHLLAGLATSRNTLQRLTLPSLGHSIENSNELVRQPGNDGAAAGGSGMRGLLEDVLAGEAPVAIAEVADLVEEAEVAERGAGLGEGVALEGDGEGEVGDVGEEVAVVAGAVGAEVFKDRGEGGGGHGDGEEVV